MFKNIFTHNDNLKTKKIFNCYDQYYQLFSKIERRKLKRNSYFSIIGTVTTFAGCFLAGSFLSINIAFLVGIIGLFFTILFISQNEKLEEKNKILAQDLKFRSLISHLKDKDDLFTFIYELENINKVKPFSQFEKIIAEIKSIHTGNFSTLDQTLDKLYSFVITYYINEPNNQFDLEYKNFVNKTHDLKEMEVGGIKNFL